MSRKPIDEHIKTFLKQIFCVVGRNSPYKIHDFAQVMLDAIEHTDFTNNTCVRIGGPTGETVFDRLKEANNEKLFEAFLDVLRDNFMSLKRLLRNRKVALAFDSTDEPYYGKVEGVWIHPNKPVQGSTGCFKFITLSCADRHQTFILGSLLISRGANIVQLIENLIGKAKGFVQFDVLLFDRGFDNNELINKLQRLGVRYQILWRKKKWISLVLKSMKRGEIREAVRQGVYAKYKSKHKVKVRFILIKSYRRHKREKAYDWVFATNTRQKSQHYYIDKYRKRWGIETVFRVLDTIQIKTTTKNPVIRYFINLFCCLVYNLWKLASELGGWMTLKNFVCRFIESLISEKKNIALQRCSVKVLWSLS